MEARMPTAAEREQSWGPDVVLGLVYSAEGKSQVQAALGA